MSLTDCIRIESAQRASGTFNSFLINSVAPFPADGAKYYLKELFIGVSCPNVNPTIGNNIIVFSETGPVVVATIPTGTYTQQTIAAAVAAAMTAASLNAYTYTATLSGNGNVMTISAGGVNTFSMQLSGLYDTGLLLGFSPVNTGSATTQTGSYSINMASYLTFDFLLSYFGRGTQRLANGNKISFTVPVNADSGGYILYQPQSELVRQVASFIPGMTNLSVEVNDKNGHLVPIQGDWYMTLQRCKSEY